MGNTTILKTLMWLSLMTATAFFTADQSSSASSEQPEAKLASQKTFARVPKVGLPNAIQVQPNLISGGQPTSQDGFRSLSELGIQTIVSVDGIHPDLNSAKKFGMKYIHLPLGYRGISDDDAKALAYIILKQDGPIYIHCHHGKHRSPAAAAVACVTAGQMTNKSALTLLEKAGTGSRYQGLFKAVTDALPVATSKLMQLNPSLPERAEIGTVVKSMIQMDEHMVQLKLMLQNPNGKFGDQQVSFLMEHATLLHENFKEMLRRPTTRKHASDFQSTLVTSQQMAIKLQELLRQSTGEKFEPTTAMRASAVVDQISNQCQKCHSQFRDILP